MTDGSARFRIERASRCKKMTAPFGCQMRKSWICSFRDIYGWQWLAKLQNNQALFIYNKNIDGTQEINPFNIDLQVDTMQVFSNVVYFDISKSIGRPFIPDGMDIIKYTVLAGNSVTFTFFYTQVSLKKFFYKEARINKELKMI